MQDGHSITYESCKLNDIEQPLILLDKEMMAIVHSLCM